MAYTTIKKPSDYFNTKLWTGNGSTQSITGVGFQPDLAWIKRRSSTQKHGLYDAVRGATKVIASDASDAEATHDGLTAFGTDGFTLGNIGRTNTNNETYASWNWLANGSGSANTDGSISSTVSASTTSGFSIVSYTGSGTDSDTVGHGLGSAPKMIILKKRDALDNWYVMHTSLSTNNSLNLDTTNAQRSTSILTYGVLSTSPTSSTFSFAAGGGGVPTGNVNNSGSTYIAYCFAEKTGFSKIGIYYSNNSSNGPFIYTGFKPSFIMIKNINGERDWRIYDDKRFRAGGPNNKLNYLEPNTSDAEGTTDSGGAWDMLSNGFKFYTSEAVINGGVGNEYMYMAFAEQPLVGDNPATAR